ncbi:MAG: N-acetyl-gamma-glutamyl-phosphate reductase [Methanobrevibacter sp.]|uniref:N-acetyl-gamma-glutamyl-phosphate reductase n=1 Tax=Methanobrevibacter millerae TaxID=230361 RepID=A0A8T3VEZ7_9EURY|nr:N-acetyl-gamma-glutamyl-phosphate reductase [Methanobrevibacter millerae]MBE6504995.1 N-acetyl-gamma-glutamyl-phosphate reductase [Methanobrevibacter millerae]MBQ6630486.1 N-acetyl-gamma-glutamyl-phosphate reductase [Methanobrevibacter sp.]MBR0059264.1 N-acetyl-gamma-glutamyl-phosphate reductase [Methanobrevibacter sp.]MBR0370808.1 N-acetyl-gamma-glutamyl-phosphate reductase [Methanobrevibacter sp.]
MYKVAIIGASGYTGGELLRMLLNHPEVEITDITSRQYDGVPAHKIHPHIRDSGLVFNNKEPDELDVDVVFTATPHGASMKIVPEILETGTKVVDLSGDYRYRDTEVYEKWYGMEHTDKDNKGVFGLPELYRDEIKKAKLVANPGCFPTGAILSSYPLVKNNLVDRIVIDSKSGVSGAGVNASATTHYPNIADNLNPYKITSHRHMSEIQQELHGFDDVKVSFTPHLIPVIRGIQTTSHSFLIKDITKEELREVYEKEYGDEYFIKLMDEGEIPHLSSVRGSNFVHIGGFEIDETGRIVMLSAIDNLVKGASGQAIQNMNIILGIEENTGLKHFGLHP